MSGLGGELRQRTLAGQAAAQVTDASQTSATASRWEAQQTALAEETIRTLEARMRQVADDGDSQLRVIKLDERRHWDLGRFRDVAALTHEIELMGISSDLFLGAARILFEYIQGLDGVKALIETFSRNDEGQVQSSWIDVYLVASWAD